MTLTAERLDEIALAKWSGPIVKDWDELITLARQAKRVPELEAEVARLTEIRRTYGLAELEEERDRYRKVAELAMRYLQAHAQGEYAIFGIADHLKAALAAVEMKVEE